MRGRVLRHPRRNRRGGEGRDESPRSAPATSSARSACSRASRASQPCIALSHCACWWSRRRSSESAGAFRMPRSGARPGRRGGHGLIFRARRRRARRRARRPCGHPRRGGGAPAPPRCPSRSVTCETVDATSSRPSAIETGQVGDLPGGIPGAVERPAQDFSDRKSMAGTDASTPRAARPTTTAVPPGRSASQAAGSSRAGRPPRMRGPRRRR